jgi:hypothetical protein
LSSSNIVFATQSNLEQSSSTILAMFGGGVLPTAETHNAVQILQF